MEQFYATQTKQPESGRSSSTMEMDLTYFINSANKRSRTIAAPAFNTGAIGSWDLATGIMGSWNPELGMCGSAAPPINSFGATPITTTAATRSSFSFINKNVPAALNTSALHKHSSALLGGAAAAAIEAAAAAIEAAADLSRGAAAVKEKKKRARPSRRVPTTVVKTGTSNFKAMVQHFTGIPTTPTTDESTLAPSASSYSPQSTISASSPSFSKTVVHPMLCKISNSPPAYPNSTPLAATTTYPSRLLPSSFPTYQSLRELPFVRAAASITGSCSISSSADP